MKVIIRKLYVFTEEDKEKIESFLLSNKLSLEKFASLINYPEAYTKSVIFGKERCEKKFVNAVRSVLYECNEKN